MFRENTDVNLPGRNPDDEGENDRSLTNRTPKPDRSTRHQMSERAPANTHYRAQRRQAGRALDPARRTKDVSVTHPGPSFLANLTRFSHPIFYRAAASFER